MQRKALTVIGSLVVNDNIPIVESPSGTFKGRIIKSRDNRDIYSFEGIPFAKPPVGDLRFKDPVKMPKLDGIFEATKCSEQCYQPPFNHAEIKNISSYKGTEDCLYLNLYVPKVNEGVGTLPVLVWIHGGGFFFGSGSTYLNGPDYLLDKDMILVSPNYRLGILGFLSTGDRVIPGNYGMKDQIMALKWVQENIASFGGNPKSVTIAGESAGGAAVSLLMHSPMSKGLFQRVIAQSGTSYSSYAVKPWPVARKNAQKIATYLQCSQESEELLKYLQKLPMKKLFEAGISILPKGVGAIEFVSVLEDESPDAFITQDSWNEPSELPLIVGVTSREAMYFMKELAAAEGTERNDILSAIKNDMKELMPVWCCYSWIPNKDKVTDELIKFYFDGRGITEEQITNIISDSRVNYGAYLIGKRKKGPIYKYMLSYRGYKNFPFEPPKELEDGVAHGEDLIYLFKTGWFPNKKWTEDDLKMSRKMVDMWYDFIRCGDPTPDTKEWKESEGGTKYLDITNEGLIMKSNMFQRRMEFLDTLNIDRTKYEPN